MMDGAHKRRQLLLLLDTDNQIAKLCKINSLFDIRNTIQLNYRLRPSSSYGDENLIREYGGEEEELGREGGGINLNFEFSASPLVAALFRPILLLLSKCYRCRVKFR